MFARVRSSECACVRARVGVCVCVFVLVFVFVYVRMCCVCGAPLSVCVCVCLCVCVYVSVCMPTPGKREKYTSTSPSSFSKKAMQWGKHAVPTNFPFFAVEAYVPGGDVQNQAEKKSENAFRPVPVPNFSSTLVGFRMQTQNAAFFERKGPERKPWLRGKSLNRKKRSQCGFSNASLLERKSLNRNLSKLGFPLGNLLPKTRVLKHRILERKRRPNANASVLGTHSVLGH